MRRVSKRISWYFPGYFQPSITRYDIWLLHNHDEAKSRQWQDRGLSSSGYSSYTSQLPFPQSSLPYYTHFHHITSQAKKLPSLRMISPKPTRQDHALGSHISTSIEETARRRSHQRRSRFWFLEISAAARECNITRRA